MRGYKEEYIKAAELGKVQAGRFYDDVSNAYLKKYGYNTSWDRDLREDQDVASDVDENEDVNEVPAALAATRSDYFNKLREVSGAFKTDLTAASHGTGHSS
ncbi:hypothetical protein C8R46DRAFT_1035136 [Mycena filopes]|nr:hypothetical protein C8R46DRAFT_1035136 [Mycena filopes]